MMHDQPQTLARAEVPARQKQVRQFAVDRAAVLLQPRQTV